MCACGTPNVNGQPGYRWQPNDPPGTRMPYAPELAEGDGLLFDEPGRCGWRLDSHCHHYRVVGPDFALLVRHGGGVERVRLSNGLAVVNALQALDSDGRYWLLNTIHHAQSDANRRGRANESRYWHLAALDKRIRVRTRHGQRRVEVLPEVTA